MLESLLFTSAVTETAQGELLVSWEISSVVQAEGSFLSQNFAVSDADAGPGFSRQEAVESKSADRLVKHNPGCNCGVSTRIREKLLVNFCNDDVVWIDHLIQVDFTYFRE